MSCNEPSYIFGAPPGCPTVKGLPPGPDELTDRLDSLTAFLAHFATPAFRPTPAGSCLPCMQISPTVVTALSEALIASFEAVVAIARQTPAEFGIDPFLVKSSTERPS